MGQIEQLVKSKLLGNDNPNNLVWPITKTQAVYDKTNTDLQTVLDSLGSEIQEIQEQFITRMVNDLANYYLKSETYTKAEVAEQIANAINGEFVVVNSLPTASSSTLGKIYLVPTSSPEVQNIKDEFITVQNNGTYSWEQIGSTALSLSGVVSYEHAQSLTSQQKTTARTNIGAGTGNYNKPSGGIPKSDLVMSIQESLEKLDNLSVEYGDSMLFDAQRPLCFVPMSVLASSGFLDVEAANDLPIFGGETTGMYLMLQNYCAASNSVRYSSVHTMKHNQEDITYLVYALNNNGTWSFGYYEVPSGVIDEATNSEIDALFV